ncbi:hypothetical protein BGZ72_008247 [Mortierella alpina]|nr:hypothetical protein BGZ72_008247 [Mortierella alpina]
MRFSTIALALGAIVASVSAAPMPPKNGPWGQNVSTVLNYALTLENLEAEFYKQGLAKFNATAFTDAGFNASIRERFVQIGQHESDHVATITSALNGTKVKPVPICTYNFPMDNLTQFLAVAQALEITGTSAYLGAVSGLSGDLLTAAAGITTVEARHSAFLNELWNQTAFPYSNDTALGPREIVTIASGFIKSCPYDIGFKPFNMLTASLSKGEGNSTKVMTSFMGPKNGTDDQTYCQFLYGGKAASSPRRECALPSDVNGYVYVMVTDSNKPVNQTNENQILAGPALLFNGAHNNTNSSSSM